MSSCLESYPDSMLTELCLHSRGNRVNIVGEYALYRVLLRNTYYYPDRDRNGQWRGRLGEKTLLTHPGLPVHKASGPDA